MPAYPAARLLVPADTPTVSDDFTTVRSPLVQGLPHFIDLTTDLRLKVTLPTGLMLPWLDAPPSSLVASSDDEAHPRSEGDPIDAEDVWRPALRVTALRGRSRLSSLPAAASAWRSVPDGGDAVQGVALDVVLLAWRIFAGTLRGPGDFGSFIQLGWRISGLGANQFMAPAINPFLRRRLAAGQAMRSQLGLSRTVLDRRFAIRRLAFDVTG
jgi:hypothetical protein